MENLKFCDRMSALGTEAKQFIESFMQGKESIFVDGYDDNADLAASDIEIDDNWPTFDTLGGDMNSIMSIQRNNKGDLYIQAILRMENYPEEFQEYSLDDLGTYALCSIADSLEFI